MIQSIEERLELIEKRNKKVEADKAWETSALRRVLIASLTYFFVGIYLSWLGVSKPWLNALVPVMGFLISTLVVRQAKQSWLRRRR